MFIAIPTVFPQTYPDGYPDSLLPKLDRFASLLTVKDFSKWKITSADTLAALLELDLQNEQVGISWFGSCWFGTSLVASQDNWPILEVQTSRFKMIWFNFVIITFVFLLKMKP